MVSGWTCAWEFTYSQHDSACFAFGELVVESVQMLAWFDAVGTVGFALFWRIICILLVGLLCEVYKVVMRRDCLELLAIGMVAARSSSMGPRDRGIGSLIGSQQGVWRWHVLVGIEETGREVQGCFLCCGSSQGDLLLEPSWICGFLIRWTVAWWIYRAE